ncbi:MAG: aldo/keto reductase [Armatimonadetes bacterium]|nr:aldo/keto reductase [Armatimonadota bacterium]
MKYVNFGKTGLVVPRLCLGTGSARLTSTGHPLAGAPIQSRIPVSQFAEVLRRAWRSGMTFWDTSDDYGTHRHIREALKEVDRSSVVLATKTHALASPSVRNSLLQSLDELGTGYVDILLFHEADTLAGLDELGKFFLKEAYRMKDEGLIRAVGLSTHSIEVLRKAATNLDIEVILTNLNVAGDHMDATVSEYLEAIQQAWSWGKGIYTMKTLGEGRLRDRLDECLQFSLAQSCVHSVCVGITSIAELSQILEISSSMWTLP